MSTSVISGPSWFSSPVSGSASLTSNSNAIWCFASFPRCTRRLKASLASSDSSCLISLRMHPSLMRLSHVYAHPSPAMPVHKTLRGMSSLDASSAAAKSGMTLATVALVDGYSGICFPRRRALLRSSSMCDLILMNILPAHSSYALSNFESASASQCSLIAVVASVHLLLLVRSSSVMTPPSSTSFSLTHAAISSASTLCISTSGRFHFSSCISIFVRSFIMWTWLRHSPRSIRCAFLRELSSARAFAMSHHTCVSTTTSRYLSCGTILAAQFMAAPSAQ